MPLHLACHSLESMCKLLEKVLDHALVVVAPAQDVIQSREAIGLTALFLMIELTRFKLVVTDYAPVITCGVHGETWGERAVHANDHGILAGAAIPGEVISF